MTTNIKQPAFMPAMKSTLCVLISFLAIGWATDIFGRLGISVYTEQYLAVILTLSLMIVFLKPNTNLSLQLIDYLLVISAFLSGTTLAVQYPWMIEHQMDLPSLTIIISATMFCLVLEALRRVVGMTLVVVVLSFFTFSLIGHYMSGPLQTRDIELNRLMVYLGTDTNGMLGLTLSVAATIVIGFVLFGQVLLKSGGADFFNDFAMVLMGRSKGGSGKIATIASALFGSISGVVVSNIVATGVVTIRMMKQGGFKPHTAAAIETVASTGGQIMPPVMGAVAFLMAEFLQISYAEVVLAALVPAILYYIALYIQIDLEAAKEGIMPVDESEIPDSSKVYKQGWIFILPFAAVIISLFYLNSRPEEAALWGALSAVIIGIVKGYNGKVMRYKEIYQSLKETGNSIVDIVMIGASAGFIIGMLNMTGLGFGLTYFLVEIGNGNLLLLLAISSVVCIVLGMGMPTVGVYLLLAVLVAPSLIQVGVEPIAAHLFIFYMGMMSMITPPIAIGAFFAASIARSDPIKTSLTAMRLGWTAYIIPFIFALSPALILIGNTIEIVCTVTFSLIGVWAVSAAFVGFIRKKQTLTRRIILGFSGSLMLIPAIDLAQIYWISKLTGILLILILFFIEIKKNLHKEKIKHS